MPEPTAPTRQQKITLGERLLAFAFWLPNPRHEGLLF
jgi:hypothetical protein